VQESWVIYKGAKHCSAIFAVFYFQSLRHKDQLWLDVEG
jgi:hypothetical protein